ncbi:MAG: helix-turn-helix transcriptional regulator [Anaerococcus sp.]
MMLGEKIKELRKMSEITQEELAEKLDVSRSAVAKWESNNGIPDIVNLKKISEIFSVSIDSLVDYKENLREKNTEVRKVNISKYVG